MVHALGEIRRVLVPEGILLDLRPLGARWPVEVASAREHVEVGRLVDLPEGAADDEAANKAMLEVEKRGWFTREHEELFDFFYNWDTPSEMKEFMETEWAGFERLEDDVLKAAQAAWAVADADAIVRARLRILITRWKKLQATSHRDR